MTTPDERQRNWRWGRELLLEIQLDKAQPQEVREAAANLGARYPSESQLKDAAEEFWGASFNWHPVLPVARDLFQGLLEEPSTSPSLRHSLRVILRHFE